MNNHIKKILMSSAALVFVGGLTIGATGAFFSDTETSTGNVFAAGSLDLKIDSEAHYNGLVCRQVDGQGPFLWLEPVGADPKDYEALDHYNQLCNGTWSETNLGAEHKFFDLHDVKPGDEGEVTISLHVYDNDAWGKFVIKNVNSDDNGCTTPEAVVDNTCGPTGDGELHQHITFYAWLDQGQTPGFQDTTTDGKPVDPGEGDNIWQCQGGDPLHQLTVAEYLQNPPSSTTCNEPLVILPGGVDLIGETHNIWTALAGAYVFEDCSTNGVVNGNTNYGLCHGLAQDGRMVGSTTYYFGLAWFIADTVGNIIQTDSLSADLEFQVVQHRNNPTKQF